MPLRSVSTACAVGTLVSCLASGLISIPALAATPTASFGVSATVLATCQATLPATTFPSFYVAVAEAASNLSVNCTHPTPYNLSLSTGLASAIYLITGKIASHASALVDDALTSYSAHPVSGGRAAGSSTLAGAGNWPVPQLPIDRQTATTLDLASGEYANTVFVNVTY